MRLTDARKGRAAELGLVVCMTPNKRTWRLGRRVRRFFRFLVCKFSSRRGGDRAPVRGEAGGSYLRGLDPQRNSGGKMYLSKRWKGFEA